MSDGVTQQSPTAPGINSLVTGRWRKSRDSRRRLAEAVGKSLLFPGGSGQHLLTNQNISTTISHPRVYQMNNNHVLGSSYSFFFISQLCYLRVSLPWLQDGCQWLPGLQCSSFTFSNEEWGKLFPPAARASILRCAPVGLTEIICPVLIDQCAWGGGWNREIGLG